MTAEKSQEAMNKLVKWLADKGVKEDNFYDILKQIQDITASQVVVYIAKYMEDEDVDKWNKFVESGANEAEQLVVMDKFCKQKGTSLEEINNQVIYDVCTNFILQYEEFVKNIAKMDKMSEKEIEEMDKMLRAGKFDEVYDKLNLVE